MKRIVLFFVFCLCLSTAHAQMLAFKTNALMDVVCAPNLTMEVATGSRSSLSLQCFGMYKTWFNSRTKFKDTRVLGLTPEFRFWFAGRTFDRFYLGVSAQGVHYNFEVNDNKRRGNALGGGLTFGYDLYLAKHWLVEFSGGLAAMHYWDHHKMSLEYDANGEIKQTTDGSFLGDCKEKGTAIIPYQLGVSFVYLIK